MVSIPQGAGRAASSKRGAEECEVCHKQGLRRSVSDEATDILGLHSWWRSGVGISTGGCQIRWYSTEGGALGSTFPGGRTNGSTSIAGGTKESLSRKVGGEGGVLSSSSEGTGEQGGAGGGGRSLYSLGEYVKSALKRRERKASEIPEWGSETLVGFSELGERMSFSETGEETFSDGERGVEFSGTGVEALLVSEDSVRGDKGVISPKTGSLEPVGEPFVVGPGEYVKSALNRSERKVKEIPECGSETLMEISELGERVSFSETGEETFSDGERGVEFSGTGVEALLVSEDSVRGDKGVISPKTGSLEPVGEPFVVGPGEYVKSALNRSERKVKEIPECGSETSMEISELGERVSFSEMGAVTFSARVEFSGTGVEASLMSEDSARGDTGVILPKAGSEESAGEPISVVTYVLGSYMRFK